MMVNALKDEMKKWQLKVSGNKKALQDQLIEAVEDCVLVGGSRSVEEMAKSTKKGEDEVPTGFTCCILESIES